MVHKVGETVEVRFGCGITGLTINIQIIDESRNVGAAENMTEIGVGAYYYEFVPDAGGKWTAYLNYAGTKCYLDYHVLTANEESVETKVDTVDGVVDAIKTAVDSPNNFKADVSALALEATLTAIKGAGWSSETLKGIYDLVNALNNITAADVWAAGSRSLSTPSDYKADVSALALEASLTAMKGAGWTDESLKAIKDAIDALSFGDASASNQTSILGDIGDASGSTLGSLYAILGNPAATLTSKLDAIVSYLTNGTYGLSALETLVDDLESRITATRAGYLDELGPSNIPADIDTIKADVAETKYRVHTRSYNLETEVDSVSSVSESDLTSPSTVTVNIPSGASILNAYIIGVLKANNQSAAEHNVGVTLQENINGGGWSDLVELTTSPPLTLPAVDGAGDAIILTENISSITNGQSFTARFQVDSDNAGEVHYTQTFVLVVEYDFH